MIEDEQYANIREILGYMIGKKIIDITQHDQEEFEEEGSFVMIMLEDGSFLKFPVGDEGFYHSDGSEVEDDEG